ncbi:MAG: hypothetical protein AAFW69_06045 [Pseudomonadota bacterium]
MTSVRFFPDGRRFAVVYKHAHAVRVFDVETRAMLRDISGAESGLAFPHGLAITPRHIILSNKRDNTALRPSTFAVFRAEGEARAPVATATTPDPRLREAHSLAVAGDVLLATYCSGPSALAAYAYDDATGEIGALLTLREGVLAGLGEAKGVAVHPAGTHVFVTFVTERSEPRPLAEFARLLRGNATVASLTAEVARTQVWPLRHVPLPAGAQDAPATNGIAVFALGPGGKISEEPVDILLQPDLARIENIDIAGDRAAVTDTLKGHVTLHAIEGPTLAAEPDQMLRTGLAAPHDACLAPDGNALIAANAGFAFRRGRLRFGEVREGQDTVAIFKREEAMAEAV